jgi:hypothetical protein
VLEDSIEARIPVHEKEAYALDSLTNYTPERGSRFSCAITIEPWMNEMPVRIGFSQFNEMPEHEVDPMMDNKPYFYKI